MPSRSRGATSRAAPGATRAVAGLSAWAWPTTPTALPSWATPPARVSAPASGPAVAGGSRALDRRTAYGRGTGPQIDLPARQVDPVGVPFCAGRLVVDVARLYGERDEHAALR